MFVSLESQLCCGNLADPDCYHEALLMNSCPPPPRMPRCDRSTFSLPMSAVLVSQ